MLAVALGLLTVGFTLVYAGVKGKAGETELWREPWAPYVNWLGGKDKGGGIVSDALQPPPNGLPAPPGGATWKGCRLLPGALQCSASDGQNYEFAARPDGSWAPIGPSAIGEAAGVTRR